MSEDATKTDSQQAQAVVHTPGPWEVAGPSQIGNCLRIFSGVEYVAIVGGSDQPTMTIRANADLIAAAPRLFKSLVNLMDGLDEYWAETNQQLVAEAKVAIDQARGVVV